MWWDQIRCWLNIGCWLNIVRSVLFVEYKLYFQPKIKGLIHAPTSWECLSNPQLAGPRVQLIYGCTYFLAVNSCSCWPLRVRVPVTVTCCNVHTYRYRGRTLYYCPLRLPCSVNKAVLMYTFARCSHSKHTINI